MKRLKEKNTVAKDDAGLKVFPGGLGLRVGEILNFEPHFAGSHVGEFSTVVTIFPLDRREVQNILPAGLELGDPGGIVSQGQHPVLLFVGIQRCVRWHAVPAYYCPVLGMRYREAVVAVPYVRKRSAPGVAHHFSAVKLYLDKTLPIYLGWIGALPKQRGVFTKRRENYRVRTPAGALLLELLTTETEIPDTPWEDQPDEVKERFQKVMPLLAQPHIGQYFSQVRNVPLLAEYACCEFQFELDSVRLRPVAVQGSCSAHFCRALPRCFTRPGIDSEALGSFWMKANWRIKPPIPC
ncbi:MAG TPA: hypothetical protein VMN36_02780 [Verrucomicrobiales bacterium]|nr:hypothetical protein [Verrucomicrobiales bacterium]